MRFEGVDAAFDMKRDLERDINKRFEMRMETYKYLIMLIHVLFQVRPLFMDLNSMLFVSASSLLVCLGFYFSKEFGVIWYSSHVGLMVIHIGACFFDNTGVVSLVCLMVSVCYVFCVIRYKQFSDAKGHGMLALKEVKFLKEPLFLKHRTAEMYYRAVDNGVVSFEYDEIHGYVLLNCRHKRSFGFDVDIVKYGSEYSLEYLDGKFILTLKEGYRGEEIVL